MSDEQVPEIYPETYVYFVVGTNLASLSDVDALSFVEVQRLNPPASPTTPPVILRMPAGYLASQTKIVYGKLPKHKPAGVRQTEPDKEAKPAKKKRTKA